jgi:mono/diheme cytochrome c family protein
VATFGLAAFLVYSLLWTAIPAHAQDSSEKTYNAKCAMCHGPDGSGATAAQSTKARDLCSDDVKKETDAEWTDITARARTRCPPLKRS